VARRRPSYSARRDAGRVDGADGSGGRGRLAVERGGADARATSESERGKRKRGGDGRKKADAGGDVTWAPPGGVPVWLRLVIGEPAVAGPRWAEKGKGRGWRGVLEMREEGGSADFENLGSRPRSITPLSFSKSFQTPLLFRFKFDCSFKFENPPK
jgi:hypothetical protein